MNFLRTLHCFCTAINLKVGRWVAWLATIMVLVQFSVVLLRYLFGYGSIFMQESVFYMHALLFILGAGYTLSQDGHVRVDIFYQSADARYRAKVNLFGVVAFLLPFCLTLMYVTIPYASQSWAVLEGSKETSGIPAVYLLKSSIFLFCGFLILQGIALAAASILTLKGQPISKRD